MIQANEIAAAFGLPCLLSGDMQTALQLWEDLYQNRANWQKERVKPLRLPAMIARELKRLALTEFVLDTKDTELQLPLQHTKQMLRQKLDYGIASGGLLLKPYYHNGLQIDFVAQNQYLPVRYTNDACTAVICPEELVLEKRCYTRLEFHQFDERVHTHTIQQRCFRSPTPGTLGLECDLSEVPQWANLLPQKTYYDVSQPLFAMFQMPEANNIDPTSPLGVSAYADAVDLIHDADVHWERMYHCLEKTGTGNTIFNTFSPEIRDTSYFNALNQILRRIESAAGLSYGTLSEVSDVEKTAEEIKSSKQRSFVRVSDIQGNLQAALEQLLYGFQYYRDYYANRHTKPAEVSCTFGDGVLEDTDKEFQRRLQMVQARVLKPELLLSWYFGCDEAEALQMLPEQQDAGGLFDGGAF